MKALMPEDWDDHAGWEEYYAASVTTIDFADEVIWQGSVALEGVADLADSIVTNGGTRVWFPGCGLSLLPKTAAQNGLEVYATDISSTAVTFQQTNDPRIHEIISPYIKLAGRPAGVLKSEIQDFREVYKSDFFDLIINTRSFQGLGEDSMRLAAKSHFTALKPGCQAIFDTINVQGDVREALEDALTGAGFLIPFYELGKTYRRQLNETGFPYVFVLGNPMIPRSGEYAENEIKHEADTAVLRQITAEFRQKQQEGLESEQEKLRQPDAKLASIIYSTG